MSIVKRQNFHLKKVKVLKEKFEVTATIDKINGEVVNQNAWNVSTNIRPHEDLQNILMSWALILAKTWNFTKEQIKDVVCTGCGIEKKGEGDHVTLTGNYKTAGGYVRGFSSPPINLKDEYYGFEKALIIDVANLKDETYAFYADDKQADLQLTADELNKEAGN